MTASMAWNDFLKSLVLFVDGSKSSRRFWENELTVSLTFENRSGVVFAIMCSNKDPGQPKIIAK